MRYEIGRKRGEYMAGNECCNVDASDLKHTPLLVLDEFGMLFDQPFMDCYVREECSVDKTERVVQDVSRIHKIGGN